MSDKSSQSKTVERPRGSLRAVEGLGPKSAKALRRMGIENCAELAQYLRQNSAQELSDGLAAQGVTVAAKKIENEDWLDQASREAAETTVDSAPLKEEPAETEEERGVSNHPVSPSVEVRFSVTFWRENDRWTVTTYDERDGGPEVVHGTDPAEWADWIMSQMTEDYELELGRVRQAEAHPTSGIEIQITDVQDSEAERFKTLAAEVSFAVSGSKAGKLAAARTPVWIYVHTADLARKTVTHVASAQVELEPEVFTYTKRLEFPIPQVGRYELHTLVVALPPMPAMTCHRGPSFPVRP